MAYVACPSCRFLVGPDDTTCRWCSTDLATSRADDARPTGPVEPQGKGRKPRRLPPPVAASAAPLTAQANDAQPAPTRRSTNGALPPPAPPVIAARTMVRLPVPADLPPLAPAAGVPARKATALAPPGGAPPEPAPAPTHKWRSRAAAFGIAAALAILGGTVGVLVLRPSDSSIASSKPSSTVVEANSDPIGGWSLFTAPDGSFAVKLPDAPKARDDKVPDGALPEKMYAANPAAVFVSNLPLTLDVNQLDDLFATSVDSGLAVLRAKATVQGQTPTRVLGLPAQEITLHSAGKTSYATFILTRHRVLLLMTASSDLALHRAFVASLQLPNG